MMKTAVLSAFALVVGLSTYARPGDTYQCRGGHWVIFDTDTAICAVGEPPISTVPGSTVPLPNYTAEPLLPSCRPIEKPTPTPNTVNLPLIANGDEHEK